MAKPPHGIKEVLTAVGFLLGSEEALDYGECKKMIADPKKFIEKLEGFDAQTVSSSALEHAKVIAEQPSFNPSELKKQSAAVEALAKWVLEALEMPTKSS